MSPAATTITRPTSPNATTWSSAAGSTKTWAGTLPVPYPYTANTIRMREPEHTTIRQARPRTMHWSGKAGTPRTSVGMQSVLVTQWLLNPRNRQIPNHHSRPSRLRPLSLHSRHSQAPHQHQFITRIALRSGKQAKLLSIEVIRVTNPGSTVTTTVSHAKPNNCIAAFATAVTPRRPKQ